MQRRRFSPLYFPLHAAAKIFAFYNASLQNGEIYNTPSGIFFAAGVHLYPYGENIRRVKRLNLIWRILSICPAKTRGIYKALQHPETGGLQSHVYTVSSQNAHAAQRHILYKLHACSRTFITVSFNMSVWACTLQR